MMVHSEAGANRRSGPRDGGGFTLLEIIVVLAITALVAAITLSGIASIGASNRRTTCQTNLSQLYQACRLYQADEGAFPFYDPSNVTGLGAPGVGLLRLYVPPGEAPGSSVLGSYLKSARLLHCPSDTLPADAYFTDPTGTSFNPGYITYQAWDAASAATTYQSVRSIDSSSANYSSWIRQLEPFDTAPADVPPAGDTVVTWCFQHRKAVGGRNYDNVLFYDGSVQLVAAVQDDPDNPGTNLSGWLRKPRPLN